MLVLDKKTGEVMYSPFSKFRHETVGLDTGSMIIQNMAFSWSDEIRDFIVVEGEKEDRQALIDSYADECGVYNVLKKYALTGDASLLSRREGFYEDISELPVDELNPSKLEERAKISLDQLNTVLGTNYSAEELSSLTGDQIKDLISSRIKEKDEKVKEEGDENA